MIKKSIVTSIFLLIVFYSCGNCLDYYVDANSGSNDNIGTTIDKPWLTITHALSQVDPTTEEPAIIHVATGLYNTELGETFPIKLKSNMTLIGAGMDSTILDATGNKTTVMKISCVENVGVSGFTLTGGAGNIYDSKYEDFPSGGGICLWLSSAVVRNCKITENSAYQGGGISFAAPLSLITDCTISKNQAREGGGVSPTTLVCRSSVPIGGLFRRSLSVCA